MKLKTYIAPFLLSLFMLSGCATSYQRNGASGGFSETRLADNMFKVHIKANGYSSTERADDFALLRSAELTIENGYRYFTIVSQNNSTKINTVNMPSTYNTRGNITGMGNTAFFNSRTTQSGGQSIRFEKPRVTMTIACHKEKPADQFSYDAHLIYNELTSKYDVPKTLLRSSAPQRSYSSVSTSSTPATQKHTPVLTGMSSERIAQEVASNCSVGYMHATPGMQDMRKISDIEAIEVLKIMNAGNGWQKAWIQVSRGGGNVYYNLEKDRVVCGDINWRKFKSDRNHLGRKIRWSTGKSPYAKATSNKATRNEALNTQPSTKHEFRPIAVKWEGYTEMFAGKIELEWSKEDGNLSIVLPNNEGTCNGRYQFSEKRKGTWSVACTNGLAASGVMQGYGSGNGSSGEGTDIHGKKVTFTLGGR